MTDIDTAEDIRLRNEREAKLRGMIFDALANLETHIGVIESGSDLALVDMANSEVWLVSIQPARLETDKETA